MTVPKSQPVPDLPAIPVGTTFLIPMSGAPIGVARADMPKGGVALGGVVLRSTSGRVHCAVLGPPITLGRDEANFKKRSLYVVDDYALQDGSWRIASRDDVAESVIPRFRSIGHDGEPLFAVYSQETITVLRVEPVAPNEREEYERAYVFIKPDIARFEWSVGVTFGLLPSTEPEPEPESEQETARRRLLGFIRNELDDVFDPLDFRFYVYFRSKRDARAAAALLDSPNGSVEVIARAFRPTLVRVTRRLVPAYPIVTAFRVETEDAIRRFEYDFDGFEAAMPTLPKR